MFTLLSCPPQRTLDSSLPYKIAMVVPGLGFDGDSLETKALGGSETAAIYMARGLARLGHKVTVFATTNRPGIYHGVNYLPFERWDQAIPHVPHDKIGRAHV